MSTGKTEFISDRTALIPRVEALQAYNQQQLGTLFASLAQASDPMLRGDFRGAICGVRWFERWPDVLRYAITRLLNMPLPLWLGKSFGALDGANLWFSKRRPARYGFYRIVAASGTESLRFFYDVDSNPRWLHSVVGEVRRLQADTYLARMFVGDPVACMPVLYFTLVPLR